jgi:uncharacterized membrane protein
MASIETREKAGHALDRMNRRGWIPFLVQIALVVVPTAVLFALMIADVSLAPSFNYVALAGVTLAIGVGFLPQFMKGYTTSQRRVPLIVSVLMILLLSIAFVLLPDPNG